MASFDYRLNSLYPIKECSSCGALYTMDYCCSEGSLRDKIICDLDKTPDLFQRSPQNCPKCGHPVDGHYCQGRALLRKKFKEDMFTSCIENEILQDSSKPSNANTKVVNALREPFVVNQDPGKNSSQSPPQINHHCCYGCGDPLEGIFCHQCTCDMCGNGAHYGYNCPPKVTIVPNSEPFNNQTIKELLPTVPSVDPTCYSEDGNSFTYDSRSNIVHDSPNVFDPPLQLPFYSCEFCGNDARYGHYCTPQEEEKQIKEEHAGKARYWKIPACYDDDDDYTIPVTPNEPDNSLSEHECDVPACEVFTTFLNIFFDADYDFYSVDDQSFSDEDIPKKIYSNPLFGKEIISIKIDPYHFNAESDLIESLLNHDSSIISSSSKIDSLFDEFAGELTLLKSIPPGINETDCDLEEETRFIKRLLYDNSSRRPPEEFISENSDTAIESFSPFPIPVENIDSLMEENYLSFTLDDPMPPGNEEDNYDSKRDIIILEEFLSNDSFSFPKNESFHFDIPSSSCKTTRCDSLMEEIDLSFTSDDPMPPGIEEDDYDFERDILILEELLDNYSLSLPENKSFHFDIPSSSRPPTKPPDGNTRISNVKMMGDISEHKIPMPRLMITRVSNQEKYPDLLPHPGLENF
uniref:Pre-mRNA splicing Prp18-interacting factor n=1 Tax=Tanacetum cinerariifolium TaxID=118510 RepID=A0A6L2KD92_TANCI|nr:hypothetical protein [Tanacetum cinerariifolium]